ncbi:DNA (cytosine-5)-methyltransferase PliMCI-like protein, partial [Leptotrombidium deliense]
MKRRKTEMNAMCLECGQSLSETVINDMDLSSANSELTTLTTPELLSVYDSDGVDSTDTFPTHRLTEYSIYDRNKHLVSVDSGLIEEGKEIYVAGFVKCIYDDDESTENGIETKDIGPINEWWIGGFDGGDSLLIGLESCSASYVLMKPSFSYLPFFSKIVDKLYLCKYTIEFLTKNIDASYEELVDYIWNRSQEKYNEDLVLSNASFLIEQIMSYDEAAEENDPIILESRCVQDMLEFFVDRAQVQKSRRSALKMKHIARKDSRKLSNSDTYATSTTLVREFFEGMFKEAIDNNSEKRSDKSLKKVNSKQKRTTKKLNNNIHWHRKATHTDIYSRITYYSSVKISDTENKEKFAHIHWFCHGSETVLKGTCDHHQIFMRYDCENVSLDKIIRKVTIRLYCNSVCSGAEVDNEDCEFICNKVYLSETGHFENLPEIDTDVTKTIRCVSCDFKEKQEKQTTKLGEEIGNTCSALQYKNVCIKNEWYSLKDCVLLAAETFECFNVFKMQDQVSLENDFDESIFTEKYRKSFSDFITGSLSDAPSPAQIGQIKSIFVACDSQEICLEIVKFYRPENVFKTFDEAFQRDLNEVFLTNETTTIKCVSVVGKCKIYYCEKAPKMKNNFPDWFYFSQIYDVNNGTFRIPCQDKTNSFDTIEDDVNNPIKKLKTFDLFAGCGGLALGFENSGVSDTCWAVEKDSCAAASFRKNFQKATVFEEDANLLLKQIISGAKFSECGQFFPKQGEVDLILAGPPCQGFSGINRFSSRQYSLFKNSLIITLLSYIDFFRPSYVVIENVRNFVLFKNSMIIKLTLSCLLKMNYQIRFGVIQAGAFGVPQSRRRAFIF